MYFHPEVALNPESGELGFKPPGLHLEPILSPQRPLTPEEAKRALARVQGTPFVLDFPLVTPT